MLSLTTDYAADRGCPEPYLRKIAAAGFTHVHWCHQWNTDFVYGDAEIEPIRQWLGDYGLQLLDLHASMGPEKNWISAREYERQAGVELVKNRIEMVRRLDADVAIMHAGDESSLEQLRKSLDALEPFARERGVRIAIENGLLALIRKVLAEYAPDYIGLCYDSGHGNVSKDGLDQLESLKDRLISVHLHDNDSTGDQHNLLFTGTVDWPRLARLIAQSAYRKCVSMELSQPRSGIADENIFLARAREVGERFAVMILQEQTR